METLELELLADLELELDPDEATLAADGELRPVELGSPPDDVELEPVQGFE